MFIMHNAPIKPKADAEVQPKAFHGPYQKVSIPAFGAWGLGRHKKPPNRTGASGGVLKVASGLEDYGKPGPGPGPGPVRVAIDFK